MQLVEIGQVVAFPPRPVAEVTIPSAALALRVSLRVRQGPERESSLRPSPSRPEPPTPEQERRLLRRRGWPGRITRAARRVAGGCRPGAGDLAGATAGIGNKGPGSGTRQLPGPRPRGNSTEAEPRVLVLVWIFEPGSG